MSGMLEESYFNITGKCTVCGQEKILVCGLWSESRPESNKFYCKECYEDPKERKVGSGSSGT
jgi:hypothetical protein